MKRQLSSVRDLTQDCGERTGVAVDEGSRCELAAFSVPSVPGSGRVVIDRVVGAVNGLGLGAKRLRELETAVAEAAANAIEHGNRNRTDLPVDVGVFTCEQAVVVVRITDQGGGGPGPDEVEVPDLGAKLRGEQGPRGWGLFLMQHLADDVHVFREAERHTVALDFRIAPDPQS